MEFLQITLTGWVAISIALSMVFLSGLMLTLGKERFQYVWGVFCGMVAIWGFGFYMVTLAGSPESAQFWWKIAYVGIIMNPIMYLHFTLEFTGNKLFAKNKLAILLPLYSIAASLLYLDLTTNLIINEVTFLFGQLYYNTPPAPLHLQFTSFFIGTIVFSLFLVVREYFHRVGDKLFRQRAVYFFIASLIAYIGGAMNFLAVYEIEVSPISNFAVAFGAMFIAYAVLRYRLFNVRVVMAQFLTLILVIFALIRLIVSSSIQEVIFNVLILIVTFVVGIYLIFSVRKEVQQREQIENLAKNLKVANERLKELDKMKSQFLSIASHDLRAPLTAIRNFMSLLLDGTYGKLPPAAEEGTQHVFERSTEMAEMVENYLNVSRIEQGRMKYDFAEMNLTDTVTEAVQAFKPLAKERGLELNYTEPKDIFKVKGDEPKLREVVENLINNALLYTIKGSVSVSLEKVDQKAKITVSDTGVGMSQKTIGKLFKLFSQGDDSRQVNPKSTGVGLYITKAHVDAHKGKIWAESDGEGKGSKFIVELPLRNA